MEIKDIKRILDAISSSDVNEFSYEKGDFRLAIKRQGGRPLFRDGTQVFSPEATPTQEIPPSTTLQDENGPISHIDEERGSAGDIANEVTAPIVGTFYLAPAPEAPAYVKVGDRVEEGTVLCIIEAMKLMNEIEAEISGTIAEILVQNEAPVEYGQPLFRIDPLK